MKRTKLHTRPWLGMGLTLLALGAAAEVPQAQVRAVTLDIKAQPIGSALNEFARQSGVQVLFYSDVSDGVSVPGLAGTFAPDEALTKLLSNTGLTFEYVNSRTVAIHRAVSNVSEGAVTQGQSERLFMRLADVQMAETPNEDQQTGAVENARESDNDERLPRVVEEIIVTAQKRKERLIDVPLSVSVLSADEIQRRGLVSREDFMRSIPSTLLRDDGPGHVEIVVRGAFGDKFSTGPTVGLYFGDVPLTGFAIGGSADIKLVDMERVEVLRGPQGTLYGSNALSGAIRYVPAAPDLHAFTGRVSLGASQTSRYGGSNTLVEGVINAPVVEDKLAVRAVVYQHSKEGYVRNIAGDDAALQRTAALFGATQLAVNKDHVGNTEYSGGRISALWHPTEQLRFNLTYLRQKDSQDDRLFELAGFGPYQRSDYQLGDVIGGNKDASRVDLDILNLTAEYDLGWGALYSSTAWMDQRWIRKWDIGVLLGRPVRPIPQISTTHAEVFAQEVRLTSSFDGPVQFVAGLYYEDSEQPTTQPTFFGGDPASNPFRAVKLWDATLDRLVTQKAVFGELSYGLTDKIELTLGARHFNYDSRFSSRTFASVVIPESADDSKAGESGKTLKATIEYKPGSDALIYATWSQGFRLGRPLNTDLIRNLCDTDRNGFLDGTDIPSTRNKVDSDRLNNYELGAKLRFMGGRATLSTAAYQNDWEDVPVTFTPPGCLTRTTINGGSARTRGFEGEGSVQLIDALRVNFGIGYVDSVLTATTSLGRDGDRMNFTPELNGSLGLELDFHIAGYEAFARGDYLYFGSYYTQPGEKGLRADSYGLVNFRVGVMLFDELDLQFHVDNALNSDAFTSVLGPAGFPPGYAVRLRPRTIGVGLAYNF